MTRRVILAVGAVLALLLTGCVSGPGGHERWLRSHDVVASITSSSLPARKFGERQAWHVVATLTPEASVADMAGLSAQWPGRARDSRLTLVRPASHGRPELLFTAWPHPGWTETRWEIFALLQSTWPTSAVAIGQDQGAIVRSEVCDPWDELDRIDVAAVLARGNGVPLTMECRTGGTVELSRRSVPNSAHLAGLRDRTRAVLSYLPAGTPWTVRADEPDHVVRIEVGTRGIPDEPSSAVLAQEHAELLVTPTEPAGRVRVRVTGESDLRPVARAVAQSGWLDRIEVDSRQGSVEMRGDLTRISEVVPLTKRHPELTWWLAESGQPQPNWVRAPGVEFEERARQYAALAESGVPWTSIVLHHNQGVRTLSVEVEDPGDWRSVAQAVRDVRWEGDMRIEIGSGYPGVVFTSTATGPSRDAEVANALRPPNKEDHPELIAILGAWDATAG